MYCYRLPVCLSQGLDGVSVIRKIALVRLRKKHSFPFTDAQ